MSERDGMPGTEDDPLKFSHLADKARAIADGRSNSDAKETMLSMARAYEATLKRAEKKPVSK
jgi:hypothetical protein